MSTELFNYDHMHHNLFVNHHRFYNDSPWYVSGAVGLVTLRNDIPKLQKIIHLDYMRPIVDVRQDRPLMQINYNGKLHWVMPVHPFDLDRPYQLWEYLHVFVEQVEVKVA